LDLGSTEDYEDSEELQPLSVAELSKGNQLIHANTDISDLDIQEAGYHDLDLDPDDAYLDLDEIEDYAQAQNESTRQGIQDIGGKFARGTKANPTKGDLDPLDIETFALDQFAGEEDLIASIRDSGIEEVNFAEWEEDSSAQDILQPELGTAEIQSSSQKKPRKPRQPKSSSKTQVGEDSSIASKPNVTSSPIANAAPFSLDDQDKVDARYGVDSDGNLTPSRFQWWERATSRHAPSRQRAKRNTAVRKSPRVRRLTSKDYWYKPLKLYTEK
jgi:hypothetical protein